MKNKNSLSSSNVKELFFKLYPIQFFTIFTSVLSGLINGLITGRYLSSLEMVALGLITPLGMIIQAVSSIITGGAGILCGKYMGKGESDKVNDVFSIAVISLFFFGAIITAICFIFTPSLALIFGSNSETLPYVETYIRGLAIGYIPTLILPCIMTFLQMSNKSKVSLIATLALAFVVTVLGLINVNVLHQGIFGMGLSTSMSQLIILIALTIYLLKKKNIVAFNAKAFNIKEAVEMIKYGAPSGLASALYAIRNIQINSTVLTVGGITASNALAILNSTSGFIDTFNMSLGSTATMLVSVFVGEKDKESVKSLVRTTIIFGEIVAITKQIVLILFARKIAMIFGGTGEVIEIAKDILFWYGVSAFLNSITLALNNTYATQGRTTLCTAHLLTNCLLIPMFILYLSHTIGLSIIWKLYTLGEVGSLSLFYTAATYVNKAPVTNLDQQLYLNKNFETGTSHSISIRDFNKVGNISLEIESFCANNGIDNRRSKLLGLCAEELVANIIDNLFDKDKKENTIDIFTTIVNNEVSLRIRDNCIPFDPHSKLGTKDSDITDDIGIKIVAKIAKEMNYQITFGMNILTIKL